MGEIELGIICFYFFVEGIPQILAGPKDKPVILMSLCAYRLEGGQWTSLFTNFGYLI
jgi:hypothetical protein